MIVFNRMIDFRTFKSNIYSNDQIVITSDSIDVRNNTLLEQLAPEKFILINFSISLNNETISDKFIARKCFNENISEKEYFSLSEGLVEFISNLNSLSRKIVIDISSLHLRFLGAFLSVLQNYSWDLIFCSYTEPLHYKKKKSADLIYSPQYSGQFDLYNEFYGNYQIPYLDTTSSQKTPFIWMVFLGFEGSRPESLRNEIGTATGITPIITVPAMNPGWDNFAFDANQFFFDAAELTCSDIEYISSINPFATYNYLVEKQHEFPNQRLIISPLSTRATSLGILLYAIKHSDCEIIYDTPKESKSNTINCGKIHMYDILSLFKD